MNAAGGVKVGNRRYPVQLIPFDTMYQPERALEGVKKLILEDGVKLILMSGGNDLTPDVRKLISRHRMLVAGLLPSDLSPDTPTLVAPSEVHPIYNVTGVDWLKRHKPHLRTAAMCAQNDGFGLPSIATYRAAFEAAGIELIAERVFEPDTRDFGPIVEELMAGSPDILCWDTAYEPFVHALTVEAYRRSFKGQLLSCTCDNYQELIRRTSPEFMEGFVFQFPDFDDPRLNGAQINFERPNAFYEEFCRRFPGTWGARRSDLAGAPKKRQEPFLIATADEHNTLGLTRTLSSDRSPFFERSRCPPRVRRRCHAPRPARGPSGRSDRNPLRWSDDGRSG